MTLAACPVPGKAKSRMLCEAFIEGAPKSAKGAVFFGVKAGNYTEWLRARASGEDWYFMDNSHFDGASRGTQFRVTKNALQHSGYGESDGRRFARLDIEVKPWRVCPQGHILVVEQSSDHMAYVLDRRQREFFARGMQDLQRLRSPIRLRPWSSDKPGLQKTLAQDLVGCRFLFTHTSAAAVMAALAGVTVVCAPECVAFAAYPGMSARLQWAGVLADNQFSIDELKDGTAWRTLNP